MSALDRDVLRSASCILAALVQRDASDGAPTGPVSKRLVTYAVDAAWELAGRVYEQKPTGRIEGAAK